MRFLVTAGSTREMIDRVRDWGNIFTGNTGYAIARALTDLGEVDLLTSNAAHVGELQLAREINSKVRGTLFTSHASLKSALEEKMLRQKYDAVFMSAAIADYQPAGSFEIVRREKNIAGEETWTVRNVQADKVKSHYPAIAILGERTEKLVDLFRNTWGYRGMLFKFKLEVGVSPDQLIQIAQASRLASRADYLIANTLEMVQGDRPGAFLLSDAGQEWVPRAELASRLVKAVRDHAAT